MERALSGLGRACGQRRNAQATRIGGITPSLKAGKYVLRVNCIALFVLCPNRRRVASTTSVTNEAKCQTGYGCNENYGLHRGFTLNTLDDLRVLGYELSEHERLYSVKFLQGVSQQQDNPPSPLTHPLKITNDVLATVGIEFKPPPLTATTTE